MAKFVHGLSSQLFRLSNSQDLGHARATHIWVNDSRRESTLQQSYRAFSAFHEECLGEHAEFWIRGFETFYQIPSCFRVGHSPPHNTAGQHIVDVHW